MMKEKNAPATLLAWLWHALVIAFLLLLPGIKARTPPWLGDPGEMHSAFLLAGAYLVSVLILGVIRLRGGRVGILQAASVTLALLGVVCLTFLLQRITPFASRSVLASIVASGVVLGVVGFALQRFRALALVALAAVVGAALLLELRGAYGPQRPPPMEKVVSNIATAFYTLQETVYHNAVPSTVHRGGGIAPIADRYLLATGDGRMYVFDFGSTGQKLSIKPLPYKVPVNVQEFIADANPSGYAGKPNSDRADQIQGVQWWQFRVADIRVHEDGDHVRLFVSHHYWKHKEQGFVVRVSSMSGTREAFLSGSPDLHWDTVFESTPCLPLRGESSVHENNPFAGMEIGGRLWLLDDHRLLLTLGDHDFTGVETKQMFSQDPAVSYGKTLIIHLDDGTSEMFTMGHRNPQGLYVTPDGTIWSTEHGPQGGDELNLLVKGANYGWPLVTYGTDYGSAGWPLSHNQGRHDGYQQPIYAWVPSIGVSNLVRIEQDRFPVWKGELLVGSLHGHSLFRLHIVDQRVVLDEPIPVGERVRDIIEGHDGRLVIWTDTASIVSITPAEGTDGAVLFANTCGGCHKAIDGLTHSYGPDLAGIVGRTVAAAPGFQGYSPAMKSFGGKWDKERLDAFLAAPQKVVPGTGMTFRGVEDPTQRAAIIKYLAELRF